MLSGETIDHRHLKEEQFSALQIDKVSSPSPYEMVIQSLNHTQGKHHTDGIITLIQYLQDDENL